MRPLRSSHRLSAAARAVLVIVPWLAVTVAAPARAEPRHHRLAFPSDVRPVGWGEVLTAGLLGSGVVALHFAGSTETPAWTRVNRLDAALRGSFVASADRRAGVRTASDVLLFTAASYPILVDDLALVLVGDRNPALLAELAAIDAQSFAVMGLVVGFAKVATSRERPYAHHAGCAQEPGRPGCGDEDRNRSFVSGHAAMSFTGAGLVCFHQRQIAGLYGTRAAGRAACGGMMALATTTGVLRIVGDKHWATDVLAGASVGLFAGMVLPWLLHGRTFLEVDGERIRGSFRPLVDRGTFGLELRGAFASSEP